MTARRERLRAAPQEAREPEAESLVAALRAIIDMEPEPYAFPDDWQAQIAACEECKRWKNHPIQQGICDTHRQPFRDRKAHDEAEQSRLHWRMRSIAREALDAHVLAAARPAPETREPELTFRELRRANVERRDELLRVKRPDFRPEHAWSLNDWLTALAGEVGEVANLLKKVHRGDFTLDSVRDELAREIGDVQTYLDLLAYAAGIDLGAATAAKWNEVSVRVGLPHRIGLGAPAPAEATERSES